MKDLSKLPYIKLSEDEQKEFARRAHIVDDNNDPPIIIDKDGSFIKTIDEA